MPAFTASSIDKVKSSGAQKRKSSSQNDQKNVKRRKEIVESNWTTSPTSSSSFSSPSPNPLYDPETILENQKTRSSIVKHLKSGMTTSEFEQALVESFIKVREGSSQNFKIWEVTGVIENPGSYRLDGKTTKLWVKCQNGSTNRTIRMDTVSNLAFKDPEIEDFIKASGRQSEVVVSKNQNVIVEENTSSSGPRNLAKIKATLVMKKDEARQKGDKMALHYFGKRIQKIDEEAEEAELRKIRTELWNQVVVPLRKSPVSVESQPEVVTASEDPFIRKRGSMKIVTGTKKPNAKF